MASQSTEDKNRVDKIDYYEQYAENPIKGLSLFPVPLFHVKIKVTASVVMLYR